MKTIYGIVCVSLLLLVCACAPKVNAPADVEAIKKSVDDYAKAVKAQDANAVAALMTDTTIWTDLNIPGIAGKEAIRKLHQDLFARLTCESNLTVADVKVSGDLGTARGTWTQKDTPKAEGLAPLMDRGSWTAILERQGDGSWKWESAIANSDQPPPGATADGAEEKALVQIELDSARALEKVDVAAFEKFLAKEWTYNADGQVMNRAQTFAEMKAGAYKLESVKLADLSPHVFGEVAVVTMTAVMKGKYKGAEIPGPMRSTDFFVKRDGRWQVVSSQNITIK
ncbi:MAG: SgcJ/EcaC family oxidoreductase [Acidobacteriota bacterium]